MLDIKELTMQHHKDAERQAFVRILMSGEIDEKLYATYLYNQLQCYAVLEKYGLHNSLFRDTPGLLRAEHIHYDYRHLWTDIGAPPEITQSTKDYMAHIESIQDEAMKLYAHIYVRHMGDLSGGQMIKKRAPGSGTMYEFGRADIKEVKERIRSKTDDSMADEARLCFKFAADLFKDLHNA